MASNENEDVKLNEKDTDTVLSTDIKMPPRMQFDEDGNPLSKRGMKKLKKRQQWLEIKKEKRAKERQKKKQQKREAIERGEELGPSRKALKKNSMKNSNCSVRVVIDSSFDEFMSEKEVNSHVLQIQFSYSANRRSENPLQFYVTSLHGKSKSRLDSLGDYKGWDIYFHEEHFRDLFKKEDIVYLSSDSPNVLSTIESDKVYIIGGLVDHNNHKGLCHKVAEEAGLAHARLPIGEYIQMYTRQVLACNHVFEVILRYTECNDWKEAFFRAIPSRKGAAEKRSIKCDNDHNSDDDKDSEENQSEKKLKCEGSDNTNDTSDNCNLAQTEGENVSSQDDVRDQTVRTDENIETAKVENDSEDIK